jgi:gamma-glutamylcyclotransferase (GGCT)/AIG2-like uncharacterized protein YtfP
MTEHLFVYGTLMLAAAASPMGAAMRARLERGAHWLGPATACGRIIDLGRYPAFVAADPPAMVHGEVFCLEGSDLLPVLDRYEGIPAGALHGREYERRLETVTLADGTILRAWVYAFIADASAGSPIASGRWLPSTRPG